MNYIYHKKPDGSIEQIEVTEENKAEKLRMYNLEKQLQEQRGKDFGTLYNDVESMPDEDKVTLGMMTQADYDEKLKERENAATKQELEQIDIKSIRGLREYLVELSKEVPDKDAPDFIKNMRIHESEAAEKRTKLK